MNVSSLFGNVNNTNSMYSLFAGANYHKTVSKYAIVQKYGNHAHTKPVNTPSNDKTNTHNNTTKDLSVLDKKFLNDYANTYTKLSTANLGLEEALNLNENDPEATQKAVEAVKKYAEAYNSTNSFLSEYSNATTSTINILKNTLNGTVSVDPALAEIGITQTEDGSILVDSQKLTDCLSTNKEETTNTLLSLAHRSEKNFDLCNAVSKLDLVKEFNSSSQNSSKNSKDYDEFMKLAKTPVKLTNYYYGLAQAGIFMDISI